MMRLSTSSRNSCTVSSRNAWRAFATAGPRYCSNENALPRQSSVSSRQHVELVVAEVGVGEHHQRQQLERRHVLAVGGGVHGDTAVELLQALLHRLRR